MSTAAIGLAVFLVVMAANVVGLAFDLWLYAGGRRTISQHVWAKPWLGVPVVAWQLAGVAGLAAHLWP